MEKTVVAKRRMTRRRFLTGLAAVASGTAVAACAPAPQDSGEGAKAPGNPGPSSPTVRAQSNDVAASTAHWRPDEKGHVGRKPSGTASVRVAGIGDLDFDSAQVKTTRPDTFQPGRFSMFDVIVHLAEQGKIQLDYHFDESMGTHLIDAVNGKDGWWYDAYHSGGWSERHVFRMDQWPFKNGTQLSLIRQGASHLDRVYQAFREEVKRLKENAGEVIIPELVIRSPVESLAFHDVMVTAHDTRLDLFRPGVVVALDALASLADQGRLSELGVTWYDRIGFADPVDHYFVETVNAAQARGGCGFVYEAGPNEFRGFNGTHIHLPSDARVIISPEYELWFWICL